MNTTRASLLVQLKNRDDSVAWQAFDDLYRPMLRRFARVRGLDDGACDDLVQDCMAAVAKHIDRFQHEPGRGAFRAWLRTIVLNRVLDLKRKRIELQADSGAWRELADEQPTPKEVFDQICEEEHLRFCLRQVKEDVDGSTYEAFRRYVIEEEPVDSICQDLGMTPNQVHRIKWRVTHRIKQEMKDLEF